MKLNNNFGTVDLIDDVLDHWDGDHVKERNDLLIRLFHFSNKHKVRVTILSGDVHAASVSVMLAPGKQHMERGSAGMYNLTSSPIGNLPAPAKKIALVFNSFDNVSIDMGAGEPATAVCKMLEWRSMEKGGEGENYIEKRNWLDIRKKLPSDVVLAGAANNAEEEEQTGGGDANNEDECSLLALLHVENQLDKKVFTTFRRVVPSY